jgi:RNA polymerase sigma factor (TIGR02999 family)
VEVTALLGRADRREALDALVPLVYDTLRVIARRQLARERRDHTLSATALAHEAYSRLIAIERITWRDRAHFLAAAAGAMRRIIVDYATARNALKRGAGTRAVTIDLAGLLDDGRRADDVLAVHEALAHLEAVHAASARVVECRVFAGMTIDEAATALGISPATVKRRWEFARAWLARELMRARG